MIPLLTALAFAVRLFGLLQTPEPIGYDGYYYVVQAETWLARGEMHAPDASWVLRFIALFARIDPVIGVKIACALLAAACVPAAAYAARRKDAALVVAAWACASPVIAHLCGEYPKNLGAAAPLLLCMGAMQRRVWWFAALGALLAVTAHKSAAALLALIALELALRRALSPRALLLGALVLAVSALTLANALHPSDLERVSGDLAFAPWPPLPFRSLAARPLPFAEVLELATPWLAFFFAREAPMLLVSLAVALPIWRVDSLDLGYRLSLFAPIVLVPQLMPRFHKAVLVGTLALALPLELSVRAHDITPPYARYREVIAQLPRPPLLIAHAGFNFLYHHETGHEAMAWAPEPELDKTQIGRLVYGVAPNEWQAYWNGEAPLMLPHGYSYWREDRFVEFERALEDVDNDDLKERLKSDLNPHRVRPRFLVRNH